MSDSSTLLPRSWCERALAATLSMWNSRSHHAWRDSKGTVQQADGYFPTATFHAITAFAQCGLWPHKNRGGELIAAELSITTDCTLSSPQEVLQRLVDLPLHPGHPGSTWFDALVSASSHSPPQAPGYSGPGRRSPREVLLLERISYGLLATYRQCDAETRDALRELLAAGVRTASTHLEEIVTAGDGSRLPASVLYDAQEFSPYILLNIIKSTRYLRELFGELRLAPPAHRDPLGEDLDAVLAECFTRYVDHHMARHRVPADPTYDPTSLAFALRGLLMAHPEVKGTAFFAAGVQAVIAGQHSDGCWPDGISVSYRESGEIIQQPSVEIALALGECVFDSSDLLGQNPDRIQLLRSALPALRRTGEYLASTFNEKCGTGTCLVSGWTSDRVRWTGMSEVWITALAAQLFYLLWLSDRASQRSDILKKYGVDRHLASTADTPLLRARWDRSVVDPDPEHARPAHTLWENTIEPILSERADGRVFLRPPEGGVSYIIFGPPGSGKTYFVGAVAKHLGWPLVSLNPGHFIRNGLEHIEATSRELFQDLMCLEHAVVFFDECDELFRDRDTATEARSILSFATATMLPKLQDLHDARRVVFILGTNYLARVDRAIRRPGRFDGILLFDRPSDAAREKHILGESGELAPKELASLVADTRGFTVPEVNAYLRAKRDGSSPPASSVADYVDWCLRNGPEELNASRIPEAGRRAIKQEWAKIPAYVQALTEQ